MRLATHQAAAPATPEPDLRERLYEARDHLEQAINILRARDARGGPPRSGNGDAADLDFHFQAIEECLADVRRCPLN